MITLTKEMYRDALHVYLKHAFPDDDGQYYSKWAGLHSADPNRFWKGGREGGFPEEVRFGCHVSGNVTSSHP